MESKTYFPARSNYFKRDYTSIIKKNKSFQNQLDKKILQVVKMPEIYKPLKRPLQGYRRVHVGPYVITFRIEGSIVYFTRIAHHDDIYQLPHD